SGKLRTFFGTSLSPTNAMAMTADGKVLALGGGVANKGAALELWDPSRGKELRPLRGHSLGVSSLAFSGDGKVWVSGSFDKSVRLWDVATGRETLAFPHSNRVHSVAITRDGKTVASGEGGTSGSNSQPGEIRLWDVKSKKERATLQGHNVSV